MIYMQRHRHDFWGFKQFSFILLLLKLRKLLIFVQENMFLNLFDAWIL